MTPVNAPVQGRSRSRFEASHRILPYAILGLHDAEVNQLTGGNDTARLRIFVSSTCYDIRPRSSAIFSRTAASFSATREKKFFRSTGEQM
jgi:hypothetical protein